MIAGSLTRSVPSNSRSPGASRPPTVRRKRRRDPGGKLPIVPPRKATAAAADGCGQPVEVALEVADDAVHLHVEVSSTSSAARCADHALGHVDGHVARASPARARRAAAAPWSWRRSRARRARRRRAISSLGVGVEDRQLRARRVVLGLRADLVEQLAAAGVVEVLGRQLLERAASGRRARRRRASARRWRSRCRSTAVIDTSLPVSLARGVSRAVPGASSRSSSSARRSPANSWRRAGRSQLRNVAVATRGWVATEPPRRTR